MNALLDDLILNLGSPLSKLVLQILVILVVARACGVFMRRLGQPQVIGEILAGIFLGPPCSSSSLPACMASCFPRARRNNCIF